MSTQPREIIFGQEGQKKLISGIVTIAAAVKSTLGAAGQTVLIESPNHTRSIRITKDGVTVAKEVFLEDPVENLAAQMVREAAERTATMAGDGTTTSIVIAEEMLLAGMRLITPENDKTEVIRQMNVIADDIIAKLKLYSQKINMKRILEVATISANNDKFIGKLVADAYHKAGSNGLVTVSNSDHAETYVESTTGVRFLRGYDSPMFITNHERDECVLTDALVLVSNHKLEHFAQISGILEYAYTEKKALLIIGNASQAFKTTIGINVVKNGLKACTIVPPQFGYKQKEILSDLALALGGKYFSEETGDDLDLIQISDLGHSKRIVVTRDRTIITREPNQESEARVLELREQIKNTKKKSDIDHLNERINVLSGGMGVIFAGGNSDIEQKELHDRIDDAIRAVRCAIEEGVIPGGGVPLHNIGLKLMNGTFKTLDQVIATNIMSEAISAPFNQILFNAGKSADDIIDLLEKMRESKSDSCGFDVKSNQIVNLTEKGILDPLKVTINAVRNATSVATTILSTNAIITMKR